MDIRRTKIPNTVLRLAKTASKFPALQVGVSTIYPVFNLLAPEQFWCPTALYLVVTPHIPNQTPTCLWEMGPGTWVILVCDRAVWKC